ncbi:MAG: YfiR family protein [Thermodesulfovibrionales bacterium]|jgi:hypothetical protein
MGLNSGVKTRIYTKSVAFSLWICSILMGVMVVMAIRPSDAYAQESKRGEYEVKAAFLYNFVKFVEWPDDKNTHADRTINICILGEDRFGNAFDFIKDETIGNRSLAIKRFKTLQHIENCHVLFISRSEKEDIEHILGTVKGLNILTVGDTEGFANKGVIINFYIEKNRVRFEINVDSLKRSGLSISSKVMHLARIIQG